VKHYSLYTDEIYDKFIATTASVAGEIEQGKALATAFENYAKQVPGELGAQLFFSFFFALLFKKFIDRILSF
jgi:hypothetical protein